MSARDVDIGVKDMQLVESPFGTLHVGGDAHLLAVVYAVLYQGLRKVPE